MPDHPQNALTYTGPMIGIGNRRYFDERFADLLSISRRVHGEVTVLMIDLDHLGQFSERYGRSAGEECLRKVGDCIAKSFSRAPDCVAQYTNEVFAVVSLGSNIEDMLRHAQRLCERVRALNIPNSDSTHGVLTISIGGVHRLANRDTAEQKLIELAERELFAAKHDGRNCVHIVG
jgi:diguanylate cyclase (GGDEF)-like protein